MNYFKIYNNLVEKSNKRKRLEFFCTHYIWPNCLTNSIYNAPKVHLTKKEFSLANKLVNKLNIKNCNKFQVTNYDNII